MRKISKGVTQRGASRPAENLENTAVGKGGGEAPPPRRGGGGPGYRRVDVPLTGSDPGEGAYATSTPAFAASFTPAMDTL